MNCSKCGNSYVVNKKYQLCDNCNTIRLHGKDKLQILQERKVVVIGNSNKLKKGVAKAREEAKEKRHLQLSKDKITYKEVFEDKDNICEECGELLPDEFEDENGNINAIYQYSHILSKKAFGQFRNNRLNFNKLCRKHHDQWEFGDKQKMNIYKENQKVIQKLFESNLK